MLACRIGSDPQYSDSSFQFYNLTTEDTTTSAVSNKAAEIQGYNGRMFIAWTDNQNNNYIKYKTWVSDTDITTGKVIATTIQAHDTPAMEAYQGSLFMAYVFENQNKYDISVVSITQKGTTIPVFSASTATKVRTGLKTPYDLAMSVYLDKLYLFYIDGSRIHYITYDGSSWSGPTKVDSDFTPVSVSVASRHDIQYLVTSNNGNTVFVKEFTKPKSDWKSLTEDNANPQTNTTVGVSIVPGVQGATERRPWKAYLVWLDDYVRESTASSSDLEQKLLECFLEVKEFPRYQRFKVPLTARST
jgi:hypothetical protein